MFEWDKYYLLPNSYPFKFNELLNKHLKLILISVFVFSIVYPAYLLIVSTKNLHASYQEHQFLKTENKRKSEYYQSIKQYNQNLQIKDAQISELNQKLQTLFLRHNLKLEQMQWHLENGKSAHLIIIQRFTAIFKFIETLNNMERIEFKEINLTKYDEEALLKLELTILIKGE